MSVDPDAQVILDALSVRLDAMESRLEEMDAEEPQDRALFALLSKARNVADPDAFWSRVAQFADDYSERM